jgi:hypothetical protein
MYVDVPIRGFVKGGTVMDPLIKVSLIYEIASTLAVGGTCLGAGLGRDVSQPHLCFAVLIGLVHRLE